MLDAGELTNPTIADMIALLSAYPPDARFRISAPDTSWTIAKIGWDFDKDKKTFWLTGDYSDMIAGQDDWTP